MSAGGDGALICGLLGTGEGPAALGWRLGGAEGTIAGREVEGDDAAAASVTVGDELGEDGGEIVVRFEGPDGDAEATLTPRSDHALKTATGESAQGSPRGAICEAGVRTRKNGKPVRGTGFILRFPEDPSAGAELFRALALPAPDDDVLLVAARREPGSSHAGEVTSAWLLHGDGGSSPFEEALVSTQYDGDGLQTRVGLELWPADAGAPPLRAAATTFGLSRGHGVAAALVASSVEGTTGTGGYLVRRP
jgi:hypothetical protein